MIAKILKWSFNYKPTLNNLPRTEYTYITQFTLI